MQTEDKLILGYWGVRGRAQPIRALLEYLNLPYEEKRYQGMKPHEEWFGKDKPSFQGNFPNLPYLKDGDFWLTETDAILRYLCKKAGRSDLLGKNDREEAQVVQTRWALSDMAWLAGRLAYMKDFEKKKEEYYKQDVIPKLSDFSKFLGEKDFLQGHITYVDFLLFEFFEFVSAMYPEVLEQFANLKNFHQKFAAQDFMKKFMQKENYIRRPFFGGAAVWNPME